MSKKTPWLMALILISAVVARQPLAAPDEEAITRAVLAVHREMNQADTRLDVDTLFQHISDADSCSIIQDGRLFASRARAYDVVVRGFQRVEALKRTFESRQVTVLNAETALLVADGHVRTVLKDGRVFESPFAVSTLYVQKNGRWQVLHGHYSAPNPQ